MKQHALAMIETVEARRLLSVSVALNGQTLQVASDSAGDYVNLSTQQRKDGTASVRSGTTSVFLDLPLLESAAGLKLTGASSTGTPASASYQVGFPITKASDYRYAINPFAPVSGEIEHTGTVTFNNAITVGDFSIGFDAARVSSAKSGFFVRDNVGGLGILFDVGTPKAATISGTQFKVEADLLVSPEFAGALGKSALTGADVGNALVHAGSRENYAAFIVTSSGGTQNAFLASKVNQVDVRMSGGDDTVTTLNIHKPLTIDLGTGRDRAFIVGGSSALKIMGQSGNDYINLTGGRFSSVEIDSGADDDTVSILGTTVSGTESINGGGGNDRFYSVFSSIKSGDTSNFESRFVW